MAEQSGWSFEDDRGRLAVADRRPSRVLAYIQAGATLWDHGVHPEGIFGSGHDGAEPDRAKAGSLPLDAVDYRGAGDDLDVDTLLRGRPDLVVAVSYGHGQLYGLDPDTAKHLEESVPVVVIDVGQARTLDRVSERFAGLARSLGGSTDPDAASGLETARERLRAVARSLSPGGPRVLALSPAGPEQAYAARPRMWPELRVLAELGVGLVSPPEGAGVNWATVDWAEAAALEPGVVLADIRSNAVPLAEIDAPAWQAAAPVVRTVPWNPEPLCSPRAHARFLGLVADALGATG
ncbi:ABC transporter substrate-binding protein [Streptomyces sp. NBC_01341]|uniref:ABC transporter substrate-binding protein n=1 Tax=Streptomyces sp. NBC_01341 TaxID=2903831 RepID=UPI002E0FD9BE|nr:ABC transporter substrate-binding protein [Streptomyces sp. NBC_01341]